MYRVYDMESLKAVTYYIVSTTDLDRIDTENNIMSRVLYLSHSFIHQQKVFTYYHHYK